MIILRMRHWGWRLGGVRLVHQIFLAGLGALWCGLGLGLDGDLLRLHLLCHDYFLPRLASAFASALMNCLNIALSCFMSAFFSAFMSHFIDFDAAFFGMSFLRVFD